MAEESTWNIKTNTTHYATNGKYLLEEVTEVG